MCIYTRLCRCLRVCMYVYIGVYMYIYILTDIHVHTQEETHTCVCASPAPTESPPKPTHLPPPSQHWLACAVGMFNHVHCGLSLHWYKSLSKRSEIPRVRPYPWIAWLSSLNRQLRKTKYTMYMGHNRPCSMKAYTVFMRGQALFPSGFLKPVF